MSLIICQALNTLIIIWDTSTQSILFAFATKNGHHTPAACYQYTSDRMDSKGVGYYEQDQEAELISLNEFV